MKTNSIITIVVTLLAAIFAYLWWQEKGKSIDSLTFTKDEYSGLDKNQKDSLRMFILQENKTKIPMLAPTEPIDTSVANQMYRDYRNSSYYRNLDNRNGCRFNIDKLISSFTFWKNRMQADIVDVRFGVYPNNWAYPALRGKFAILLYPVNNKTDINPLPVTSPVDEINASLPLNLGDLYP
jgi:hypothetical protein